MKTSIWKSAFGVLGLSCLVAFVGCESYDADSYYYDSTDVHDNPGSGSGSGGGSGDNRDEISLDGVVWLGVDVSAWPRTATLNANISGASLNLDNDKANTWPPASIEARGGGAINAVAWVFVKVDGRWHAATWEWLRTGQHTKLLAWVKGTDGHIHYAPLHTWKPRSGEIYGFMVSTPARGGIRTINERSNVSLVTWP